MREFLSKKLNWTIDATVVLSLVLIGMIFYVYHITYKVETLKRVVTTDRDLLKKYSRAYFLNENYTPQNLTPIPEKFRSKSASNYKILTDVAPYLEDLLFEAQEEGLNLLVHSAYRSFGTQSELKSAYKVTYGQGAHSFSADQGYSEHQLGTAVDFTTGKIGGPYVSFAKTPEYQWLLKNAHNYGFIISYPAGNNYYKFEPWHWRYVGLGLAKKLHQENVNFYEMDQRVIDNYLADIFD